MTTQIKGSATSTFGGEIKTNNDSIISNRPAFSAYVATGYNVSSAVWTKITYDTEIFDSNNAYDNSTNYRFTVPSGKSGKYQIDWSVRCSAPTINKLYFAQAQTYLNGVAQTSDQVGNQSSTTGTYNINRYQLNFSRVYDLSEGDYIEVYVKITTDDASDGNVNANGTFFNAHKLIV